MDLTTLAVAVVGLAGTLTSPMLGQQIADRTKRREFDFQSRQQREEREETHRQAAVELKRSTYAALNTAARQYQQQLEAYVRAVQDGAPDDAVLAELMDAREKFRELYSEAQMILPDAILEAAMAVSGALGDAYGIAKRLGIGKPRTLTGKGEETIAMAEHSAHVTVYNCILHMRHLMRKDLGISDTPH
jgi:type II secretory pathway pseudopilin PulG